VLVDRSHPACLDVDTLADIVDHGMPGDGRAGVELHLDQCARCRRELAALMRLDGADGADGADPDADAETATPTAAASGWRDDTAIAAGIRLGRYFVLERLGAGGMGTVWAAYDPELDRRVALKVLRPGGAATSVLAARLRREAQVMARLSHPNVVPVHDVGAFGDQLFVAMELVPGATLRDACKRAPSWRDALALCLAAGCGLSAAHAAGVVHRDFKPDNVLCGADGSVKVTDFGLARLVAGAGDEAGGATPVPSGPPSSPVHALTHTGLRLGTPAYMAPEQYAGGATDAATDQFSYCVTVYEAVYGDPPFDGDTVEARAAAAADGRVRPAPAATRVPSWVRAALLRGLRPDPRDRHPSLDALLAALAADPARRRRRRFTAAAAVVAVAGAAVAARALGATGPRCGDGRERVAAIWGAAQRDAGRAAFLASGRATAGEAFDRVAAELDRYGGEWRAMRLDACEATRERAEQSETLLDLRMACLDERLAGLASLATLLANATTGDTIDRVIYAVADLAPLAPCADVEALLAAPRPPDDPARRRRHDDLRGRLAAALALSDAGRSADAMRGLDAIVEQAIADGLTDILARAFALRAWLQRQAGEWAAVEGTLAEAMRAAAQVGDDDTIADARIMLVMTAVSAHRDVELARERAGVAEAAVLRAGGRADHRIELASQLADVAAAAGSWDEAVRHSAVALAIDEQRRGDDPSADSGYADANHCRMLRLAMRFREADAHCRRAVRVASARLGEVHPDVARVLVTFALNLHDQGRAEEALVQLERAIAILDATAGERSATTPSALTALAGVYQQLGRHDEALRAADRALAATARAYGAEHPAVTDPLHISASILLDLGRPAEAARRLERALRLVDAAPGQEQEVVGLLLTTLGEARRRSGHHRAASRTLARAVAILERVDGPDHPVVGDALLRTGENLLDTGRAEAATRALERAVSILRTDAGNPTPLAAASFALGRALDRTRTARGRSLELARHAAEIYRASGAGAASDLAAVERWLRARPAVPGTPAASATPGPDREHPPQRGERAPAAEIVPRR
jgi:tetratricopeptide (TPR) repeat protein